MSCVVRSLHLQPRTICRVSTPSYRLITAFLRARPNRVQKRWLQSSSANRNTPNVTLQSSEQGSAGPTAAAIQPVETGTGVAEKVYYGPLAQTFRRLKIFSIASLVLSTTMTPFIFILETASAVPFIGRVALAATVLATSSVSTAMVAWTGRPYVHTLTWLPADDANTTPTSQTKQPMGIELRTFTMALHEQRTRVYDTAFLVPTTRPFATWELAQTVQMPRGEVEAEKQRGALPREETVAEELDYFGKVSGRWIVRWAENGTGTCYAQGKIFRYFNVHEELLDRPIR